MPPLTGPADGCWLVRGSQSLDNRLCLSLWTGGTISRFFHIIIPVNRSGGFYLDSPAMGFASMADLLFFYAETKRGFVTQTGMSITFLIFSLSLYVYVCVCEMVYPGSSSRRRERSLDTTTWVGILT